MSFASVLALLVSVLIAAPVVAHLLRRRRTEVRPFPPAHLVPAALPIARRRSRLEDRALFALRASAILALALLGATPFVRCSRLSVGRRGGGSIALLLVVDDSLSMRAKSGQGTRFARASAGAREVLSSLREGDAVAIVLAGAPARIALSSTTDLNAARRAIDALAPSDRGTDLDGALQLVASLSRTLPQPDRRAVLLSDLSDGKPGASPLGAQPDLPLWIPLPEIARREPDCGVVRALRRGPQVRVTVACGEGADASGRAVLCFAGQSEIGRAELSVQREQEVEIAVSDAASGALSVRLSGGDAVAEDDAAPVVAQGGALQIAVVSDLSQSAVLTGGPSPVEQALTALDESVQVRPLPTVPEDAEGLSAFGGAVLDDPPGLTPEARAAFRAWLDKGGVGLLLLGPHSGGAILGASFDPFTPGVVRWSTEAPPGADRASAAGLGVAAEGLLALAPKGRALLDPRAAAGAEVLARWSDGAPLLLSRPMGRGSAQVVTLPGSVDVSDLPLRPAFLELLSRLIEASRARSVGKRSVVGTPWAFREGAPQKISGPAGPLALRNEGANPTATPERVGLYTLARAEGTETRVVEIDPREVDLSPRPAAASTSSEALGSQRAAIDVSPYVALLLMTVIALEAAVRLWTKEREARA